MKTDEQLYFALGLAQGRKDRIWRYGRQRSPEKGEWSCYAVACRGRSTPDSRKVVALCKETHVPFTKRLTAARLGQNPWEGPALLSCY